MRKKEIADRLKLARARAGFTSARSAAGNFGWNPNTYKAYENASREISTEKLFEFSAAFNVDANWLLTGVSPISGSLSEDEMVLIEKYRKLDQAHKTVLQKLPDALAQPDAPQGQQK